MQPMPVDTAPPTLQDSGPPSWKDEADREYAYLAEVLLVCQRIKRKYTSTDVDQAVQDAKLLEATDINNAGIDEQLSYLNAIYGVEWLRSHFKG